MSLRAWPVRKNVLVNLKTGKGLKGVLYRVRRLTLELAPSAEEKVTLFEGRTGHPVDGHVVIDRANVDFLQVVE